jgi:ribosomal protein L40E
LLRAGLVLVFLWRFFAWVSEIPVTPDPWSEEIEKKLRAPDAVEICHRCFTPQPPTAWFCEHCGSAVGPYNNLMPYVSFFSQGEVLRNGVTDRFRASPLIIVGYLVYSLSCYTVFAPIYWYRFFKNLKRQKREQLKELP